MKDRLMGALGIAMASAIIAAFALLAPTPKAPCAGPVLTMTNGDFERCP